MTEPHFSKAEVILLRGAPAVGKSTVAIALADVLGHGAIVEVDQLRAVQSRCDWKSRAQHQVALAVAADCARSFVAQSVSPVIVVDTFGRDRLPDMQRRLIDLGLHPLAFSLWSTRDVLHCRAQHRGDDPGDFAMSDVMNTEIRQDRFPDESLIDTTEMAASEVARIILDLSGWRLRGEAVMGANLDNQGSGAGSAP